MHRLIITIIQTPSMHNKIFVTAFVFNNLKYKNESLKLGINGYIVQMIACNQIQMATFYFREYKFKDIMNNVVSNFMQVIINNIKINILI